MIFIRRESMRYIETGSNWIIKDELDLNLIKEIKKFLFDNLKFLHKDKKGYSTSGKNAEQYWIQKPLWIYHKNPKYDIIENKIKKEVYKRIKKASLLRDDKIDISQSSSWTIIGNEGSYHKVHTHCDGISNGISVVLYLDVPQKIEENDNGIFFILHTNPSSPYIRNLVSSVLDISVEVGTLLIFPNHVPHGTYPQTKGVRQTLNIDYEFTLKTQSTLDYNHFNYF